MFLTAVETALTSHPSAPTMAREEMERGVGLLLWVAEYRRELRPWPAEFYHALAAPVATLVSISAAGWAEVVGLLLPNLFLSSDAIYSSVRKGWKVMALGSQSFAALEDVNLFRPPLRARSWLRVNDPRSKDIRLPATLASSVSLWKNAIRLSPQAMVMRRSPTWRLASAADAWATGARGGIGGWWQTCASTDPKSFGWFDVQLSFSDFPVEWDLPENLQRCISSLELFAQLALLLGRFEPGRNRQKIAIRQSSDSTPTEGAINIFSLRLSRCLTFSRSL